MALPALLWMYVPHRMHISRCPSTGSAPSESRIAYSEKLWSAPTLRIACQFNSICLMPDSATTCLTPRPCGGLLGALLANCSSHSGGSHRPHLR
eukprot:6491081-Amphidinium_carterae.3